MGLVKIGRVIRPHGVKGGMKVSSSFKYKNKAFKKDNTVYINNKEYKIINYTFCGGNQLDICYLTDINTIDDVISIRQNDIYIDKKLLGIDEILDEELLNMEIYHNNDLIGVVSDIQTGINPLIITKYNGKRLYIPRQDVYIDNIDVDNNRIDLSDKYKELI
jgi:16S rRNA processing protein RimM